MVLLNPSRSKPIVPLCSTQPVREMKIIKLVVLPSSPIPPKFYHSLIVRCPAQGSRILGQTVRGVHWVATLTPIYLYLAGQMKGHPNIVGMLGVCGTAVVTEYYSTNFLGVLFRNKRSLPIRQIVSMALDAARGLQVGFYRLL